MIKHIKRSILFSIILFFLLTGCAYRKTLFIADPAFMVLFPKKFSLIKIETMALKSERDLLIQEIDKLVSSSRQDKVIVSPLYSTVLPFLAEKYPQKIFFSFQETSALENLRFIKPERRELLIKTTDFISSYKEKFYPEKATLRIALVYYIGNTTRQEEYQLLKNKLRDLEAASILLEETYQNLRDKNRIRSLCKNISEINPDLVLLFLGPENQFALENLSGSFKIITENRALSSYKEENILFSMEFDYRKALDKIATSSSLDLQTLMIPAFIRPGRGEIEKISPLLKQVFPESNI